VTLLFGPNSAGKSTIIHAIHYAHAVLESSNPDVGRTRLGGDIDLGGFANLVHDHDLDAPLVLGFKYSPDDEDVRERLAWYLHMPGEEFLSDDKIGCLPGRKMALPRWANVRRWVFREQGSFTPRLL
jgi:hypothetical protein